MNTHHIQSASDDEVDFKDSGFHQDSSLQQVRAPHTQRNSSFQSSWHPWFQTRNFSRFERKTADLPFCSIPVSVVWGILNPIKDRHLRFYYTFMKMWKALRWLPVARCFQMNVESSMHSIWHTRGKQLVDMRDKRCGFPRPDIHLDLLLSTVAFITVWSRAQTSELACLAGFVEVKILSWWILWSSGRASWQLFFWMYSNFQSKLQGQTLCASMKNWTCSLAVRNNKIHANNSEWETRAWSGKNEGNRILSARKLCRRHLNVLRTSLCVWNQCCTCDFSV